MNEQPLLPYGGWRDPNSGFPQGAPTSEERARRDDADGTTTRRQRQAVDALSRAGHRGLTWHELGARQGWHHGQSSGVLSVLHKTDRVARLAERRDRSAVYVLPEFVDGRDSQPHGGRAKAAEADLARIRENFASLLSVYTSDQSLVAVSRIRKCLDGRYP